MSFETAVLEQALNNLFTESSFSICTLRDIGKLVGVNPTQHPNYKLLQALHCVDYADMSPEILQELQQRVAECLRPQFQPGALAKALLMEGNDHANTEDYSCWRLN